MEFDAGIPMSRASAVTDGTSLSSSPQRPPFNHHDTMWSMNMRANEMMEAGPYPERPGEPDCSYFIRTGLCRFGATCRYNHPPNRQLAIVAARMTGEFPKRIGQPECQFYLKTGTCKFGATCKFHHPREKAGIEGRVSLNALGYPVRANEIECVYYLRTGRCKFGSTCKFHHPQPSSMMVSVPGSPIYQSISSPTTPGQQSYSGIANWPLTRTSFVPNPRWQVPSSYAPLIVPSGAVSVPGWNSYTGQFVSASSSETQQQGNSQIYGSSQQNEPINPGPQGTSARYGSGSIPIGFFALQRDNVFPERPGQPECQFYMKTGDCKFGAVCRFHHPRERSIPPPDCLLSSIGLPLRPGQPLCVFYSRYGICKFGPSCKFDHPMEIFTYNLGISSSLDAPIVRRLLGSTSGSVSMGLSEGPVEAAPSTKTRRLMLPEARKMASGDADINIEG